MKSRRTTAVIGILAIALLFFAAPGWSGEDDQATVNTDNLNVHASMSESSRVVGSLEGGSAVVVDLEIERPDGGWCSVRMPDQTESMGYVPCRYLDREPSGKMWNRGGVRGGGYPNSPPPSQTEPQKRPYSDIQVVMYMTDW